MINVPITTISFSVILLLSTLQCVAQESDFSLDDLQVPEEFEISYYAENIEEARSIRVAENGWIFISSRRAGNVYATKDKDGDGVSDVTITIVEDWTQPNGIALNGNDLYVAEIDKVWKFEGIVADPANFEADPQLIFDELPENKHHGWRYIGFGPDGKLYIAIGAPCNICDREEPYFATISRINKDGSGFEVVYQGIRNSVGFDWDPKTNYFWFTDNNRDWMGDDLPACELNVATSEGGHYGFPYCHQGDLPDPKYGKGHSCSDYLPPAQNLGAHTAPLGIAFLRNADVPEKYRNQLLIAEHGSWNRTVPIGYRIRMVEVNEDQADQYEDFVSGWLDGDQKYGRPVDIAIDNDGSILVTDDFRDAVYRIKAKK